MKKIHGLYIVTLGIVVLVCYFLSYAICSNALIHKDFLESAWPMPLVFIVLTAAGVYVYIQGKE